MSKEIQITLKLTPKQIEQITGVFKGMEEAHKSGAIDHMGNMFNTIANMRDKGPVFDAFSTMIETANDKINAEQVEAAEKFFNVMGDPAMTRGFMEFVRIIRIFSGDLTALIGPIMAIINFFAGINWGGGASLEELQGLVATTPGAAEGMIGGELWERLPTTSTPTDPSSYEGPSDPAFPY